MKNYLKNLIIIFIISLLIFGAVNLYLGWDIYKQSINSSLVSVGVSEKKSNKFDFNELKTDKYKEYSTDFYTFYYPQDYVLSVLPYSITFTKDLEKIAELKIVNLKSENFEDFNSPTGNYFFTQSEDLADIKNLPEFFNSYLLNQDNSIKKTISEFYIANSVEENSNELAFKKYRVNSYQVADKFKIIGLNETDNTLNNIVVYSNDDLIVVANLTMPSIEEYEYFTSLLSVINIGVQKTSN